MSNALKNDIVETDVKDLTDLIKFSYEDGKVWFGEQRMLLMHVSAMAAFRRELLNSIGIERAKGFFLRLGYQAGIRDAELSRRLRPNSKDIDIFLT